MGEGKFASYFTMTSDNGSNVVMFATAKALVAAFDLRFAMTVNKLQGKTLTQPFTIHEWDHPYNDAYKKYTSCSRAERKGQYTIMGARLEESPKQALPKAKAKAKPPTLPKLLSHRLPDRFNDGWSDSEDEEMESDDED